MVAMCAAAQYPYFNHASTSLSVSILRTEEALTHRAILDCNEHIYNAKQRYYSVVVFQVFVLDISHTRGQIVGPV